MSQKEIDNYASTTGTNAAVSVVDTKHILDNKPVPAADPGCCNDNASHRSTDNNHLSTPDSPPQRETRLQRFREATKSRDTPQELEEKDLGHRLALDALTKLAILILDIDNEPRLELSLKREILNAVFMKSKWKEQYEDVIKQY